MKNPQVPRIFTWRYFTVDDSVKTVIGLCFLDGEPYSQVFAGACRLATEKEARGYAEYLNAKFVKEPYP